MSPPSPRPCRRHIISYVFARSRSGRSEKTHLQPAGRDAQSAAIDPSFRWPQEVTHAIRRSAQHQQPVPHRRLCSSCSILILRQLCKEFEHLKLDHNLKISTANLFIPCTFLKIARIIDNNCQICPSWRIFTLLGLITR